MKLWNTKVELNAGVGNPTKLNPKFESNKQDSEKTSIENYKALEDVDIKLNNTMTAGQISKVLNEEKTELIKQYTSALIFIKKTVGERPDQQSNISDLNLKLENLNNLNFALKDSNLCPPVTRDPVTNKIIDLNNDIKFLIEAKKESESLTEQMIVAGMINFFDGNLPEGYSKGSSGSPVGGVPAAIATVVPVAVRNREIITRMVNAGKEIINIVKTMTLDPAIKTAANRALQTLEGHVAKLEKLLDSKQVEAMTNKTYNETFNLVTENNAKILEFLTILTELKTKAKQ